MTRYHPLLVALHWLMAIMIPLALAAGGLLLASLPDDSPEKVEGLGVLTHWGFYLLIALIVLHVAAALYHQFIVKDSLLRRMWFGKRS